MLSAALLNITRCYTALRSFCSTSIQTKILPPVTKKKLPTQVYVFFSYFMVFALKSELHQYISLEKPSANLQFNGNPTWHIFIIDSIKQTFMTYRQKAMKNTQSSKWKNNNSKEKIDIVKCGFVIILIKIVGYNDPEASGTLKRLQKHTCVWQSTSSASGCGNIPDCLAGLLTAVSAAILILSSNMCRKFTASFHLVTKEHSAPGFPLPPSTALSHVSPPSSGESWN